MIGPAGACLALALAGCGAGAAPRTPPRPAVPAAQSAVATNDGISVNRRTERTFHRAAGYCAAKLAGRSPRPPATRIRRQVEDLLTLERTDPGVQVYFGGADESLSAAFGQLAASLRPCDPVLADEVDAAAAALPEA